MGVLQTCEPLTQDPEGLKGPPRIPHVAACPMALLLAVALGTSDNPPCQCSGFGAWLSFRRFGLGNLGVALWMPGRKAFELTAARL